MTRRRKTATVEEVLQMLRAKAQPEQLEGMARYGLTQEGRLGVKVPELRRIAKQLGQDHDLALALWETGVTEARIIAAMVEVPAEVSGAQMDAWVQDFNAWDVCDQVCMHCFEKTSLAWEKVQEWSTREEEFVKRAAYALVACMAWHDKHAPDEAFLAVLPVIRAGATDGRNMVRKAVSWALRNIGKRNPRLQAEAMATAEELQQMDARPAQWIARDVVRDLTSPVTKRRLGLSTRERETNAPRSDRETS